VKIVLPTHFLSKILRIGIYKKKRSFIFVRAQTNAFYSEKSINYVFRNRRLEYLRSYMYECIRPENVSVMGTQGMQAGLWCGSLSDNFTWKAGTENRE
jgi:hypothetical protein